MGGTRGGVSAVGGAARGVARWAARHGAWTARGVILLHKVQQNHSQSPPI
ncbi:hypothetical protein [Paenibacillus albidus]|nr:hypothetical protein [Paenibacillus albidus]